MTLHDLYIKAIAATAGAVSAAAAVTSVDWGAGIIGVPTPVVVAASVGALAGIALGDPIEPRKKLFMHAFAYTVLGAACAILVPFWFGWHMEAGTRSALAVASGAVMRWLWPVITDNLKTLFDNIPFLRK